MCMHITCKSRSETHSLGGGKEPETKEVEKWEV